MLSLSKLSAVEPGWHLSEHLLLLDLSKGLDDLVSHPQKT